MKHRILFVLFCVFALTVSAKQNTSIAHMRVEYQKTPLAIEEANPRFSWQMMAEDGARHCFQKAYSITVADEQGQVVWNSGKVLGSQSLNIRYAGMGLKPHHAGRQRH